MPPGSKKRKAAKKKKENQPSNTHPDSSNYASAQSQGSDDVKHQDDKESNDVWEVNSPASDDHCSHGSSPLAVGEDGGVVGGKNDPNPLPDEGIKIEGAGETNVAEEVDILLVERESKVEDDLVKQDGCFNEKPDHRGSSGSSSSSHTSSDDESHGTKSQKEAEIIAPVVGPVTTADSSSGSTNAVSLEEAHEVEIITSLHESVIDDITSPAENSVSPSLVKPAYEESEEKKLTSLEDKVDASTACKDAESDPKVEEMVPSVEKLATYSNPKACISQTSEDQLTISYDAPAAASENGASSGVNEPLLRPVPHQVQTTSWMSCCGLFEVFGGSGR